MAKVTEPVLDNLQPLSDVVPGLTVEAVQFSPDTYGADACFRVRIKTNRSTVDVGWVKPGGNGKWLIQTPWVGGPLGWSIKGVNILTAVKRLLTITARQRIS